MIRRLLPSPALLSLVAAGIAVGQQDPSAAPLPAGVRAVWDLSKAWTERTATRERICLNGLWNWQPSADDAVPRGNWGWFKVPGSWPGIPDYLQKDCQTVIASQSWAKTNLAGITAAWYERKFTVPAAWKGRRITLDAAYVNSLAEVFVDGVEVGTIAFPAGEVDLSKVATPGPSHTLSIHVVALPLAGVKASYADTNSAKQMQATVARRGLCGDLFLSSTPAKSRIESLSVATSIRKWTLTIDTRFSGLDSTKRYKLAGSVLDRGRVVKTFVTPFEGNAATAVVPWRAEKLWDLHTPENQYDLQVTLLGVDGKLLDAAPPHRFGFRELWIDGRDFILNGTRVFWSCVPMDNAQVSAGLASYAGARESMRRLKSFGINMVYTHNYDCNPGSYLAFDEILRAADDVGMLVALTQPHFGNYDWSAADSEEKNGYARHAAFFASVAGSHPCVVAYSTSHNACGYNEDMNPDLIDGLYGQRDQWALNNMKKAIRAEAIIHKLDPSRIVYHHSSGNLGSMHTMNFYANMAPVQEMDDWFEHWATAGVKPAFTVEYGVPFSWDWTMYRGWYAGTRTFGSAAVPWEYCMAEWNAQFLGDAAFPASNAERANLRWEAQKVRAKQLWHRWDYPQPPGSTHPDFDPQQSIWAKYTTDNWRAFRTWGVSGISPWETHGVFWRLKPGVGRKRVELTTDWDNLQRPGYSPDYVDGRYERMDLAYEADDWEPTEGGRSLIRNNGPLLGYIGGRAGAFTEKSHNFRPGQTVEKQLILINNSRRTVSCRCTWTLGLQTGSEELQIPTGTILQRPIRATLPNDATPGGHVLSAEFRFGGGEVQRDEFELDVLPPQAKFPAPGRIAIYDPVGETAKQLSALGGESVTAHSDLDGYDLLLIGKKALAADGEGPDLSRVRDGLKVIVFEQTAEALERRFGFRVQEYGLRQVFPRVPGHPALLGLSAGTLCDWAGEATTMPPRLAYQVSDKYNGAPAIVRNGLLVTRAWRCGCRGSVASVLIEKPHIGDFTPIADGGFSLQYTPLLEYREGKGMVLFCQLDVTGRTAADPGAEQLLANLIGYAAFWKPAPERSVVYSGTPDGRKYLSDAGFAVSDPTRSLGAQDVLVLGPGGSKPPGTPGATIAVGLDADALRGLGFGSQVAETIDGSFTSASFASTLAGIGPADLHSRDPRPLPLVGGNVLAADGPAVVFGLAPWALDQTQQNTRRTFRHAAFVLARLLGNVGARASTPLLARFAKPGNEGRSLYLDTPQEWDDPYRFFRW